MLTIEMTKARQLAPSFKTKDVFGKTVSLNDYNDSHDYVLLAFLRYAGCEFCNLAIHRLAMENKRLQEASCQVIAFVQSDEQQIIDNIYDRHTPKPQFPISPDKKMKFYKQYNVEPSVGGTLRMIADIPQWVQAISKFGFIGRSVDENLFLVPAWFLVSTGTGEIVRTEKGANFYEHVR
jgi:peroxiredoxin